MANRYANLVGTKKISEDFGNINIGFDRVQAEMDTKGTPADAQAKANAAKDAAIAAAAADLAAHKARGADEHPTAKGNAAGFMSAADKSKSDASTSAATPETLMQRDAEGRAKVAAPASADDIARKAETDAVQTKLDSHAADTVKHVTQAEHDKLQNIQTGAEVNQNAFAKINDVSAGSKTDTVTLVGGTGITITTDPANKRVSITATGEATPGPHALSHIQGGTDVIPDAETGGVSGLMSGADAQYLRVGVPERFDEIEEYVADQIAAIPPVNDASLTDKGIVQLSNKTDGDAENVAATEKAVNDARLSALSASKTYVDEKSWQKHPLTKDNGRAIELPNGYDLNNLTTPGVYIVTAALNGPSTGTLLVDVSASDTVVESGRVSLVFQKVTVAQPNATHYQRIKMITLWYPWSVDLFTSVSDGKTAIAAAITGKGVAASGSDTFPQLATKIGQISTGPKYATGTVTSSSYLSAFTTQQGGGINLPWVAVTGLGFRPNRIIIRIAGTTTNLGMTVYNYETRNAAPTEPAVGYNIATVITSDLGSGYNIRVYERVGSSSSLACVNFNQFFMPVSGNGSVGLSYTWEAFQV